MKTLKSKDEEASIECDCGHVFYVNACTEENLYHYKREDNSIRLQPVCPSCKRKDVPNKQTAK